MIALNQVSRYDSILVGGGLQSGLLALAIKQYHPDARVLMIERGSRIAGNHTWSFHPGDVPATTRSWVGPLIQYRWDGYEVRLENFHRHVGLQYASVSSEHFAKIVSQLFEAERPQSQTLQRVVEMALAGGNPTSPKSQSSPGKPDLSSGGDTAHWRLLADTEVVAITEHEVATRCGQTFHGDLVIDCRGPSQEQLYAGCGYQKFFGFELELSEDWPDEEPALLDKVEDQSDGFHFIYALPFSPRRVLVEDTRFSDTPDMDREECLMRVSSYVQDRGIARFRISREESGVLPMPFTSERKPSSDRPLAGGYRGGWFHSATGYSFPMAVAFAHAVASGPLDTAADRVRALSRQHRWRATFSRFLNRLLFRLVAPAHRRQIFKRFYRILGDSGVERFYSHRFKRLDAIRIVVGIPPTLFGLRPFRFIRSFFSGANQ